MCAQYLMKMQAQDLEKLFGITLPKDLPPWPERISPHMDAPVITPEGLRLMNFTLLPSWSLDKRQKFSTFNARIEALAEKPTWRRPFESQRCLIPMSSFIEPIYVHEYAGNMVNFERKDHQPLVAAGIYDHWVDKETGEVIDSFAMITSPALDFVKKIGHDRSPLFLPATAFAKWLTPAKQNPQQLLAFLKDHRLNPPLTVKNDRAMKPGWEKRKTAT